VSDLIAEAAARAGIVRRSIDAQEIVDRCLGALRSEGKRILDEGVAMRPVDIDMVYVHGFGFPAWRGGPMFSETNA
jgi:3-hydroxyacyl-CoA dehydrogenase